MARKIKVTLYDDNNSLRKSLEQLIQTYPDFELAGSFPNPLHILENTKEKTPDVILMDIDMPGMTGIEAVGLVHKNFPNVKVVMQTVFDEDEKIFESICNGAVGYILKKTPPLQILDSIKQAKAGGAPMTPTVAIKILKMFRQQPPPPEEKNKVDLSSREQEILSALTKGMSYKMIAEEIKIGIDTVRFHIKNIYEKLHVHSNTEAVSRALKEGLI
jgi:DNA-binding NarL/FixJ family response regulator